MRIHVIAAAAACCALSACSTTPLGVLGASGTSGSAQALHDFLNAPTCAHHDEAEFVSGAGGIPASFHAKLSRDCPAVPSAGAPVQTVFIPGVSQEAGAIAAAAPHP